MSVPLLLALVVRAGVAQFPAPITHFYDKQVHAEPHRIVVNDTTRTAVVTLVNPTDTPRNIWLTPECGGDGTEQPADPIGDAWHNHYPCAAPWLSGLPQYLLLAPHERRTFPVRIIPYPTLADGRYTARVMWNTPGRLRLPGDTLPMDTTQNWGGPHQEIDIIYNRGRQSSRRPKVQWSAVEQAVWDRHAAGLTVRHTPALLVLDDHRRTATFTLSNPGTTAMDVWLTVDCPWFRVHYDAALPHGSQVEESNHQRVPNIAAWLTGYPQHLVLAPHGQQTITLQLILPNLAIPMVGSYYAQVRYVQSPIHVVTTTGHTVFVTPHGAIDVVFHRNVGTPALTLSDLHVTQYASRTQACFALHQPGLAVIAFVHAAIVDPATGRPEGAIHVIPYTSGEEGPPWVLDTTVVVWEVMHHPNTEYPANGTSIPPEPVCFTLPELVVRHHRLIVSATTVEDTTKLHLVEATTDWDDIVGGQH